jgi:hypothetical protein
MTNLGRVGTALVVCLLAGAASARAAITPTLASVIPNGDGTFTYVYDVDLAADQAVLSTGATPIGGVTPTGPGEPSATFQDYFTIYDFAGLVGGATQPAGWAFGFNTVGPTPSTTSPADDPTLYNVFWVRTGDPVAGPAELGRFTVNSAIGLVALKPYTSDATQRVGAQAGSAVASSGTVFAPQLSVCTTCAGVSEPPIGWLAGFVTAVVGVVVVGRRAVRRPI